MSVTMTADLRGWTAAVNSLARQWNVGAGDIMRYQFALWGRDLAVKTWPQRRPAEQAVSNDAERAFMMPTKRPRTKPQEDPALFLRHARDKRTGRVRSEFGTNGNTRRLLVARTVGKRVIREQQRHVGRVHAGWLRMISDFGGRLPPSWITRHGKKEAYAFDNLKDRGTGLLAAENRVPYAKRMTEDKGVMRATLTTRQKDLDGQMGKRAESFARWFNAQR